MHLLMSSTRYVYTYVCTYRVEDKTKKNLAFPDVIGGFLTTGCFRCKVSFRKKTNFYFKNIFCFIKQKTLGK
jgi:hypothetical protein